MEDYSVYSGGKSFETWLSQTWKRARVDFTSEGCRKWRVLELGSGKRIGNARITGAIDGRVVVCCSVFSQDEMGNLAVRGSEILIAMVNMKNYSPKPLLGRLNVTHYLPVYKWQEDGTLAVYLSETDEDWSGLDPRIPQRTNWTGHLFSPKKGGFLEKQTAFHQYLGEGPLRGGFRPWTGDWGEETRGEACRAVTRKGEICVTNPHLGEDFKQVHQIEGVKTIAFSRYGLLALQSRVIDTKETTDLLFFPLTPSSD